MEKLIELLNDLHPEIDFTNCNNLITDGILDSFDIVSLISEIAQIYNIRIKASSITAENFNCIQSIYNLIMNS